MMGVLLISCERESNLYDAGSTWINSDSRIVLVDTLTLKMSTFIRDSVVTSGSSKIVIGNIEDNGFGKITSSSLFELTPESYEITETKPVYDSCVMYLTYNDTYYGDTLKTFKLNVFPMENRIKLNDEGELYNNSSRFKYSSTAVASKSYLPRPNTDSTYVRIPLDDSYGQSIFNLLKGRSIDNQEEFLNHFKGLAIVPSEDNNAMMRYGIDDTYIVDESDKAISTLVRLYYHTAPVDGTEVEEYTLDLKPSTTKQYNKISYDFSGSELQGLTPDNPIPSASLGNKTFLISGIGVYTKVEIPYLKDIKNLFENYDLLSANLYLQPVVGYYNLTTGFYNPDTYYYMANKHDEITTSLSTSVLSNSSNSETAIEISDKGEYLSDYNYTYPISYYITSVLNETSNNDYSILIYPTTSSDVMVNQLTFGDQKNTNNPAELELYFVAY